MNVFLFDQGRIYVPDLINNDKTSLTLDLEKKVLFNACFFNAKHKILNNVCCVVFRHAFEFTFFSLHVKNYCYS